MDTIKHSMVTGSNVTSGDSAALLLRKELKKLQGIFRRIQPSLSQLTISLLSNRQNHSSIKLNLTLRSNPPCQAEKKEKT
jgi:hypothetical protein